MPIELALYIILCALFGALAVATKGQNLNWQSASFTGCSIVWFFLAIYYISQHIL